jgi:hypothetical protein
MKVLQKTILIMLLAGIISLSACKKTDTAVVSDVTPKQIYYDIESIKIDISSAGSAVKHLYDPEPFVKLQEEVLEGKLSRQEIVYRLQKIIAAYNCTHLSFFDLTAGSEENGITKASPLEFGCFGNDFYVTRAALKYSKYLGWKLTGIGDYSAAEAIDKVGEYIPSETPAGKKYNFLRLYYYEDYVYYGFSKNGKLQFSLESSEGKTKILTCRPSIPKKTFYVSLKPVTDTPFSVPVLRNRNYGIKPVPENKTLYIPFNSVRDSYEYSINNWISDLIQELNEHTYKTIVFDVRYNSGGKVYDMIKISSLLYEHKEELEKYNIAVIASGRTYSAACTFIDEMLRIFPHVKIFGEETGQAVLNYTAVHPQTLKRLNCHFAYPTQIDNVPQLTMRSTDTSRGTFPDVEILETFEGYLKGEDAVYKAIYEYYKE